MLTLHLNDLNSEFYDLDYHQFPDKVRVEYLRRSVSQKNGIFVVIQDDRFGKKFEIVFLEARYKPQSGNVKHGRTFLVEKYRNKIDKAIDLNIKSTYHGQSFLVSDSTFILNFVNNQYLFQTTLKIPELSPAYANCGKNCAICESQSFGCKFCSEGPRKQFPFKKDKFFMGCKGDPAMPVNQCPQYYSKIACLIKKKEGFKFNLKLSTHQTSLQRKAVFEVTFEDSKLEPYLDKDLLAKKLGIKDQSALCSKK